MTVAVVGAGITGLAVTHHLAERGVDVVTFEASEEAGGMIQSRRHAGETTEAGPQRVRLTPGVEELATAAGVTEEIQTSDATDLSIFADGGLREAPTSRDAFLRTDLLSWRAKLRLLAEPLTEAAEEAETVADVFTRKFGRQVYERVAGPLYGGLFGSDPAEMPAAFALSGLMEREAETGSLLGALRGRLDNDDAPPATVTDGLQTLPNELAETYDDAVRLGEPVTGIGTLTERRRTSRALTADGGGRYVVTSDHERHRVSDVVVTTPAGAAADLLDGLVAGADGLRDLTYNRLAMVYLQADRVPSGVLGYQTSYDADHRTLGVSFNGEMFDRGGLCTAFLGGMHDPEVLAESDDRLASIARGDLATALDCSVAVAESDPVRRRIPAYDQTWWATEQLSAPPGVHLATNYTARMGIPSRVREARETAEQIAG